MASATSSRTPEDVIVVEPGVEPGASAETMLVTTEVNFEEFEQELTHNLDNTNLGSNEPTSAASQISEIQLEQPPSGSSGTKASFDNLDKPASVDGSDMVSIRSTNRRFPLAFLCNLISIKSLLSFVFWFVWRNKNIVLTRYI